MLAHVFDPFPAFARADPDLSDLGVDLLEVDSNNMPLQSAA